MPCLAHRRHSTKASHPETKDRKAKNLKAYHKRGTWGDLSPGDLAAELWGLQGAVTKGFVSAQCLEGGKGFKLLLYEKI